MQAQEGSASLVDLPDRCSSPPPGLPKESGQIGEALVLTFSVPAALSAIRPPSVATNPSTMDLSVEPPTSQTTPLAVTEPSSAASTPLTLTSRGLAEPSSAARASKVVVKGALGILSSAADGIPIPGVKAIFDTIIKVIGVIEATQANEEGFKALEMRCQTLMDIVIKPMQGRELSDIPLALQSSLAKLKNNLAGLLADVEKKLKMGKLLHTINHEEDIAIIKEMNSQITHFMEFYSAEVMTSVAMTSHQAHQAHQAQVILQLKQNLPWVTAGFDHRSGQQHVACLEGTREQLMTEIKTWIHDSNSEKPIYVLYGIAGIGKSTVAQTVAEYAASRKLLGASFFFSRTEDELKNGDHFFSTLAFQLALYDGLLGAEIASALQAVPDAPQKNLAGQFKHLVIDPIQKRKTQLLNQPIIVVIDAVDECLAADAKVILELLSRDINSMPNFKIFVTTRPEAHIRTVLATKGPLQPFYLHEIERSVVIGDIELFLKHALSMKNIQRILQEVQWEPKEEQLNALVSKCGILFIMASTAVRYIIDEGVYDPSAQMTRLLTSLDVSEADGVTNSLDNMYLEILRCSIPKKHQDQSLQYIQKVIGAIVVLEDPLPLPALAKLLEMQELTVKTTIRHLYSIIAPGSGNQAPQLYHKSFPDFITNKDRCSDARFYISPGHHHSECAQQCFKIMKNGLHENMFGLQGLQKYMTNIEIMKLGDYKISHELKYACMYWANHLSKAHDNNTKMLLNLLHEFTFTHLLHWIEVLSLIEKLEVAYPALQLTQQFLSEWNVQSVPKLQEMLRDGSQWVAKYYEIIRGSALHVYHSALLFMPKDSQLYMVYHNKSKACTTIHRGQASQWNPFLTTLEGHSNYVTSIAFSANGFRLASGSNDKTTKLWHGLTGAYITTLEGHSNYVTSVAFSPDCSRLASGSEDKTIKLWNGITGTHIATLEGHSHYVTTVLFSPDGSRLASASRDNTLKLWDGLTGTCIATLQGHSGHVTTVTFSPDGSRLASGSNDCTVKLWEGLTGAHIATLEGHSCYLTSVQFSLDGSRLASGSRDKTVKLWNGLTGVYISTLEGHSGSVTSVSFSSDGSRLASGSHDETVKLWNGFTGAYITTLEGHSDYVRTVAFSPDGSRLASGSNDKTVKLWDGLTGIHIETLGDHSGQVTTVAFSSDGSRLASGSHDNTVNLWDRLIEVSIPTPEEHSDCVTTIAFSRDGSRLASGSNDNTIKLWDGLSGAHIGTLQGHSDYVTTVAFSPDGFRLASGSQDHTVKLWDGFTGAHVATLEDHSDYVRTIAFSPDGSRLASGSDDMTVKLWDGITGTHIATLEGHSHHIITVGFSADGFILTSKDAHDHMKHWGGFSGSDNTALMNLEPGFSGSAPNKATQGLPSISSSGPPSRALNGAPHTILSNNQASYPFLTSYIFSNGSINHSLSKVSILHLPSEFYHPFCTISQGKFFVMGFPNGIIILLSISPDKISM